MQSQKNFAARFTFEQIAPKVAFIYNKTTDKAIVRIWLEDGSYRDIGW